MPGDEHWINCHETDAASDGTGEQHGGLAETNNRNVHGTPAFRQTGLLEMTDDERIVAGPLRRERGMDLLLRAAKFCDRVKVSVRRRNALHIDIDARRGDHPKSVTQAFDI